MWKPTQLSRGMSIEVWPVRDAADERMHVRDNGRRAGAAAMATAIVLLLLTWWARGAADAAQPLATAAVVAPLPVAAWVPRWIVSEPVRESGAIAAVGSGLIALAGFVRWTADRGPRR